MSATRIFSKFKELLDVTWSTVSDGYFLKRSGTNITGTLLAKSDVGLGNVDNTSDANKPVSTAQQTALNLKEDKANKAAVNGYASLDASGKVPAAQLPASSGGDVVGPASAVDSHIALYSGTTGKLIKSAGFPLTRIMPVGSILDYAGATEPAGWIFCYGQLISRTTYALLFSAIGTAFSAGDGSTTFGVPDLRSVVTAGREDMGGAGQRNEVNCLSRLFTCNTTNANATVTVTGGGVTDRIAIGDSVSGAGITAGAFITNIPTNTTLTISPNATATQTGVSLRIGAMNGTVLGATAGTNIQTLVTLEIPSHNHVVTIPMSGSAWGSNTGWGAGGSTTAPTGGGQAHRNTQPTTIINKIIFAGV